MAKRARLSPGYLRKLERNGVQNWRLACLLADIYECRVEVFLPQHTSTKPSNGRGSTRS
jgi:hypothetical protein